LITRSTRSADGAHRRKVTPPRGSRRGPNWLIMLVPANTLTECLGTSRYRRTRLAMRPPRPATTGLQRTPEPAVPFRSQRDDAKGPREPFRAHLRHSREIGGDRAAIPRLASIPPRASVQTAATMTPRDFVPRSWPGRAPGPPNAAVRRSPTCLWSPRQRQC